MRFFYRVFFSLLLLSLLPAPAARAYANDTHYGFTYAMARSTGFTPLQAARIAAACASVDDRSNGDTEPAQLDDSTGEKTRNNRIRFHALLNEDKFPLFREDPKQYQQALKERDERGRALNTFCREVMHNPGVYLHFLQDSYAHWGYGSTWGHFHPTDALKSNGLAFGTRTDFLSFEPDRMSPAAAKHFQIPSRRNQLMVKETLAVLRSYQTVPALARPDKAEIARQEKECLELLADLQRVNPAPTRITDFRKDQNYHSADNVVNLWLEKEGPH